MKSKVKIALLGMLGFLGACSHETNQERLRQIIFNADDTYQLSEMALIPLLEDKVPGVTLTEDQKAILKRASNILAMELNSASQSIAKGDTISEVLVNTIDNSVKSYAACLEKIKTNNSMPSLCVTIGEK